MHNYFMVETSTAKELSVAEAIDAIVGLDSSYVPMDPRLIKKSQRGPSRTRLNSIRYVPICPRLVFMTASYPRLDLVREVKGFERFIIGPHDQPEVIPSWQMAEFMRMVENLRAQALKQIERQGSKQKSQRFKSFRDVLEYLNKTGETADPETGEISQAA